MNLVESLELFGIDNIVSEDMDSIKKKYRRLMKKYHPDMNYANIEKSTIKKYDASDINDAYQILSDVLRKAEMLRALEATSRTELVISMPLSKLIDIYDKRYPIIKNEDKNIEVTIGTLNKEKVLFVIEAIVNYKGINYEFTNIQKRNMEDSYNIDCDIPVNSLEEVEDAYIRILGEDKKINLTHQSTSIILTFKYNIKVKVKINKKIIKES